MPMSDHSANAAFVSELKDDEPKYYGGTALSEKIRDEMDMINSLSHGAGARSSHEPPAPTKPTIESRGRESES